LRVTLRAASADWVPRLALRLGGELRVVTPPDLAEQVRRRASGALAAYAQASPNG
jgi:proteasome accessory factor C